MGRRRADPRRVPEGFQHLVALPPVARVEEVDAVAVGLALAPVEGVEVGHVLLGPAVGMALRVAGGMGRAPGYVAVGRRLAVGVAECGHGAPVVGVAGAGSVQDSRGEESRPHPGRPDVL